GLANQVQVVIGITTTHAGALESPERGGICMGRIIKQQRAIIDRAAHGITGGGVALLLAGWASRIQIVEWRLDRTGLNPGSAAGVGQIVKVDLPLWEGDM